MGSKFTFIDLFSGIGGFIMALENKGGRRLHFSEISADAVNAYCENSDKPIENKIKLADILSDFSEKIIEAENEIPRDLFGEIITQKSMSLSTSNDEK